MKIPTQEAPLMELAHNILLGAIEPANVSFVPADLATALTANLTLLENAANDHEAKKDVTRLNRQTRRSVLKQARAFVADATSILKPRLGSQATAEWEKITMTQGTIRKPRTAAEVLQRLDALKVYFTANPTHEVAGVNVTAARATALAGDLTAANGAVNAALVVSRDASMARVAARGKLASSVRAVESTLGTVLTPVDNAWYSFGMPRPVDLRFPAVPGKPTVIQMGPGTVHITFAKATRATRYRVFVQAPQDEVPRSVATVRDPMAMVEGLPSGVVLRFTVTGANSTGESQPSEATEITLG